MVFFRFTLGVSDGILRLLWALLQSSQRRPFFVGSPQFVHGALNLTLLSFLLDTDPSRDPSTDPYADLRDPTDPRIREGAWIPSDQPLKSSYNKEEDNLI